MQQLQHMPGGNGHLPDSVSVDQVTYINSHNAAMAKCYGWLYVQQNVSITKQYEEYGARSFKIPLHWYKDNGVEIVVAHEGNGESNCKLTYYQRGFKSPQKAEIILSELSELLYKYEREIVILKLETYLTCHSDANGTKGWTNSVCASLLDSLLKSVGMDHKAIVWKGNQAPTLGECRESGKNLILMIDSKHLLHDELAQYCLHSYTQGAQIDWSGDPLKNINKGEIKRGMLVKDTNIIWSNFLEIHYNPENSFRPDYEYRNTYNKYDQLSRRYYEVEALFQKKPNILAADFVDQGDLVQFDEIIPDDTWEAYLIYFKDSKHKIGSLNRELNEPFPVRHRRAMEILEATLRVIPKGPKPNSEVALYMKKLTNVFLTFKRELFEIIWDNTVENDLMGITVYLLEIIEDYPYLFWEMPRLFIEMFTFLTLKDCSLTLLINSITLKNIIIKLLNLYLFTQQKWNPLNQVLFILQAMLIAHYQFILTPQFDLIQQAIMCFNYSVEQTELTIKMQHQTGGDEHAVRNKRVLRDLEDKPKPEDLYNQIPGEAHDILVMTLALLPSNICEVSIRQKFHLHLANMKQSDIFRQTLSIKILQTLAADDRYRTSELLGTFDIFPALMGVARLHEYFTVSREAFRTISYLLSGFDDMLLWFKFDSLNMFDNSNRHIVKIHGDPVKLPEDSGLFYDGCGCDFLPGAVLELQQPLKITQQAITISFWMVMFSTENSQARSQATKHQIRTLLGCSDGVTSLVFTDTYSQLFGITNVSEDPTQLAYGLKFFPQKDAMKVFQGWNHITIVLDNKESSAYLYVNGVYESNLQKVRHRFDIQYIGNHVNLEQPFGYVCDLRVYPRTLVDSEIKQLGHYDKTQILLNQYDVVGKLLDMKLLIELRKLLGDSLTRYYEASIQILKCIALLCQASTQMRLECCKQNFVEFATTLVYHEHPMVSYYASRVLNNIR